MKLGNLIYSSIKFRRAGLRAVDAIIRFFSAKARAEYYSRLTSHDIKQRWK